jgi:probable F420-dependent oxidoreductase
MRPFRFMTSMPPLTEVTTWRDRVRRIEDLGFSTVTISDHLAGGWAMEPIVAMTVAAEATTRLRVGSAVLNNDLRHPALLHRAMANLDVFSEGRIEIGLGAGWWREDYAAAGIDFDPPSVRLGRLEESVTIVTSLFQQESVDFAGKYYGLCGLAGVPRPVQRPHPPLLIGGGSRGVLSLAGRLATIASLNARMAAGMNVGEAVADQSPARIRQKIGWVAAGAIDAGREPADLELSLNILRLRVDTGHGGVHQWRSSLAAPSADGAPTLAALEGSVAQCVDTLLRLRAEYGISYLHLGNNLAAAGPLVAALAGR